MQRSDSLLSENQNQSERINLHFLGEGLAPGSYQLCVSLQISNNAPKLLRTSKVYQSILGTIQFVEPVSIEHIFEVRQTLTVELKSNSHLPPGIIKQGQCTVGSLFASLEEGKTIELSGSGSIKIIAEKANGNANRDINFILCLRSIQRSFSLWSFLCFSIETIMFRVYKRKLRQGRQGTNPLPDVLLYESEPKTTGSRYAEATISERIVGNSQLVVKFYDFGKQDNVLGETILNIETLMNKRVFELTNSRGASVGSFEMVDIKASLRHNFSDFLFAGMKIALSVYVDFTASNGIPTNPSSRHYHTDNAPSQYERGISQVAQILMDYDFDKLVPMFGFGAKLTFPRLQTGSKVHHCFPLTGDIAHPEVRDLLGIQDAYRKALKYTSLAGPTLFSPLLREAMQQAKQAKERMRRGGEGQYLVLLVLTDGQIDDYEEVMNLLVDCSHLPISIIIVGIGEEDWALMHKIDNDDLKLKAPNGRQFERDLVQFVEFNQFQGDGIALAREVLQELPEQCEKYHELQKLTPESYKGGPQTDAYNQLISRHSI